MKNSKFIPVANPYFDLKEANAVYQVIKSGWISMGKKVKEFEKKICKYIGVKHAILFNNGTSSLHAALVAMNIKENDEVIVPTLSYISSANVINYCRAKPIFCDSNSRTFNVDVEDIEPKITKKTKAIIIVDMKGMPADFDEIILLARQKKIPVLGDSAESFGAIYKKKKVGSQLDAHSFSFFANKNLTMGEGGLVTTNNDDIAIKCRIFRNQGQKKRYEHIMIGNNYRLTDYAAAFGLVQLSRAEWVMKEKNKVAKIYDNYFKDHNYIEIPYRPKYVTRHSWYNYSITFNKEINRNRIIDYLNNKKIETRLSFPPIHLQPIYKKKFKYKAGSFPKSENAFNTFLDIPCWAKLEKNKIEKIVEQINKAIDKSTK